MAKTIATDGHSMSYDDKTKFVGKIHNAIHNIVMEEN
jgi:hypothetical protein